MRKTINRKEFESIKNKCEFINPAIEKAQKLMQRGITTWVNPSIPQKIILWKRVGDDAYEVPFGAWEKDERVEIKSTVPWLRDYQIEAVENCSRHDSGVIVAPCGSGKTQAGIGLIEALKPDSTLIIVHSIDLMKQWKNRIDNVLGSNASGQSIAHCGNGSVVLIKALTSANKGDIIITTVQTLVRVLQSQIVTVNLVIVDEAHHCPASTYTSVLERLEFDTIYGLTATPHREDGLGPVMLAQLGPIRYSVSREELVKKGHTLLPQLFKVETPFFTVSSEYSEMITELSINQTRNNIIWDQVQKHGQYPQLILSQRVDHCVALAGMSRGLRVATITGSVKDREKLLQGVAEGLYDVLIATQLADEGLDVVKLCAVHLVLPSRAAGRLEQRVGRICRPSKDKGIPTVFDYVDMGDSLLQNQWRARRKVYLELGIRKGGKINLRKNV